MSRKRRTTRQSVDGNMTDRAMRAIIRAVVEAHEALALDDETDRETLVTALVRALTGLK